MIPQAVAAQAASKNAVPIINIVNKQVRTTAIVTGVIIGSIILYYSGRAVVRKIQKKKAEKLNEVENAKQIHAFIEEYAPKGILWWLNPINNIPATTFNIVSTVKGAVGLGGNKVYDQLRTMHIQNPAELIKAYHWLYHRDLPKDLLKVLGEKNYVALTSQWSQSDIKVTGYSTYNGVINVKQGKKITKYTAGQYAEYSGLHGLVIKDTEGFYVTNTGGIKPASFKKGNYGGQANGFKIGNMTVGGGVIYTDTKGNVGIYLVPKVNGANQPIILPIDDVLLFDSLIELNSYAQSKGWQLTTVKI